MLSLDIHMRKLSPHSPIIGQIKYKRSCLSAQPNYFHEMCNSPYRLPGNADGDSKRGTRPMAIAKERREEKQRRYYCSSLVLPISWG